MTSFLRPNDTPDSSFSETLQGGKINQPLQGEIK